jgi:hypothetical protein
MEHDDVMLTYEKDGKIVVPWRDPNGRLINLLTPEDYRALPLGTVLGCIDGQTAVKSPDSDQYRDGSNPDYIDDDTRGGRIAWGTIAETQEN